MTRPHEIWEVDLTYVHCGIDGWGYLFSVFDIFTREWIGYCFDLSAVKENAIISIENGLVSHKEILPGNNKNKPIIRADNGSQYTIPPNIILCNYKDVVTGRVHVFDLTNLC